MKDTTANAQLMIKEILTTCLIDFPDSLTVEPRELGAGGVYWTLQGHADDYRKICGAGGAHIKALTWIMGAIGVADRSDYKVWLKESTVGQKRPMKPVEPVDSYDPRDARDLLCRLLESILGPESAFAVNVEADGFTRIEVPPFSLLYTFEISVRNEEDYNRLGDGGPEGRTIVDSISTIWRAYAAKSGVAFEIKLLPL
jgi:predicted RNA-binding protein YlqC (UPF0109 family)